MKKLRILIADDHALLRGGVRAVLESRRNWKVVGEATTGPEAIAKAVQLKPDVAVVDLGMPGLDGTEIVRRIRGSVPETKVLVLTIHESELIIRRALEAGAHGYLLKSDMSESLPVAVQSVAEGRRFLTSRASEIVLDGFLKPESLRPDSNYQLTQITRRETQIVRLLSIGKSNKEIAAGLGIATRTVETHRSKIMLKLGVHSIAELIHYAMRNQLVSLNEPVKP